MIRETLKRIYTADLRKVISEVELYENEEDLWRTAEGISNSGGNLVLHIVGNLNHFFGANLGHTGYRRERDLEFSDRDVTREELIARLEETLSMLETTIEGLSDEDLHRDYPEKLFGERPPTLAVVIHMLSHMNYHLGQINYHRRLVSK